MRKLTISISNPCREKWTDFSQTTSGGFCGSCHKNVIDFTKATDDEIFQFFKNKPAHACGRFYSGQLKTYYEPQAPSIYPGFALLKAGFVGLLFILINKPASAQIPASKQKTEISNQQNNEAVKNDLFHIKGVVTCTEDGSALPGVNVYLKNKDRGTSTDENGHYEMTDLVEGDILVFSFIGLQTSEFVVTKDHYGVVPVGMDVSLAMDMGEVSVNEVYSSHQGWLRNAWFKLKGLF